MRTTLTLDDDIAAAIRDTAGALNRSSEHVVNETLRRGMTIAARGDSAPFKLTPNRSGFSPGIDPLKLSQLSEDL